MNTIMVAAPTAALRMEIKNTIIASGIPLGSILLCKSAEEAAWELSHHRIDILVTALSFTGMSGYELLQRLQGMSHAPQVIVISGSNDFHTAVSLLRLRVRDCLLLPIDEKQLAQVLLTLDAELAERRDHERHLFQLGRRQLYQLLLESDDDHDSSLVYQLFGDLFSDYSYYICCVNNQNNEMPVTTNITRLGVIDCQEILLLAAYQKTPLLLTDFKEKYVGFSSLHNGIGSIRSAYSEALTARRIAFLESRHSVEFAETFFPMQFTAPPNERQMLEELPKQARLLGTENFTAVLLHINQLSEAIRTYTLPGQYFEKYMLAFLQELSASHPASGIEDNPEFLHLQHPGAYSTLLHYLQELTEWLQHFNTMLTSEYSKSGSRQKINEALAFIHNHYCEDLNMAVVSNYISMNYSLFSVAFRQYTGMSFMHLLKKLRTQEAMRLLTETEMLVSEIAHNVGYENERSFMKIFKSVSGVSPTEYRRRHFR